MATSPLPARLPFKTRFSLQVQVRLVLAIAFCLVLGAMVGVHRYHGHLSSRLSRAMEGTARQGQLAGQIGLQILLCCNLEDRLGLVWDIPNLRRKRFADWSSAQARLEQLLEELQATPMPASDRRQVAIWQRAILRHGEGFRRLFRDLDQGRLTSEDKLRDALDRKEYHLRALLQAVEGFAGRRMAALRAEGAQVQRTLRQLQGWALLRAILAAGMIGATGWWFSRRVVTRIRRLTMTVSRFAGGDLEVRAPAHLGDELGILCHQFNEMAAHIQDSLDRLNREIAQHKETTAALIKAQEAARIASRAKGEFLATVSHEIRTPMTAILGFAEILAGNASDAEAIDAAAIIRRNGTYLLEIIDDILDLSKIEAGKLELNPVPCSPRQILADVIALMRVRAEAKGLPLNIVCEEPIPETIHTDPTRLRQILINLVGNAIKFTESGGVRVVVRPVETDDGPARLCFDVIDSGIGIDAERIEELFTPFTQGDSSMRRKFGGSGLGLAISRRLAEMLGGTITVASQAGKGSTFTLTIAADRPKPPCRAPACVGAAGEASSAPKEAHGAAIRLRGRVLLAEDGPDNQRLISFLLRKAGAEVVVAENGKTAVEKVLSIFPPWQCRRSGRPEPFDLILMDMQMPVMDGYEASRRLRREGYQGPIIALTAHAMQEDRQKCLDAGCDDYIAKPINRDQFLAALAAVLPPAETSASGETERTDHRTEVVNGVDS